MQLWRISNYADLSGTGGMRAAGRWHTRGRPIVYLADHPGSAVLEMLVHLDRDLVPDSFRLLRLDVPDDVSTETVDLARLPDHPFFGWRHRQSVTREIGDQWLDRGSSALLRVPSAIVPEAWNVLLNPAHADASRIVIAEIIAAPFDPRLLGDS